MPFTFSHPAIILPFLYIPNARKWFSATGLIIGSIIPDFEYFLRMKIQSNYSHTLIGLCWFDIPLACIITFVFHNFIRNTLIDYSPKFLQSRVIAFKQFDWNEHFKKKYFVVIISILLGASSHLFWDSFTHHDAYFVNKISLLRGSINIFEMQLPVLKILQHGSTFLGGIVMFILFLFLPKEEIHIQKKRYIYWLTLSILTILVFSIRMFFMNFQIGNIIVSIISSLLLSLLINSFVFNRESPI